MDMDENYAEEADDEDLKLLLDMDLDSAFVDLPSPDGSQNITTMNDIFDAVMEPDPVNGYPSVIENMHSFTCSNNTSVDYENTTEVSCNRAVYQAILCPRYPETDQCQAKSMKNDSCGDFRSSRVLSKVKMEEDIPYNCLIPTTVETVDVMDQAFQQKMIKKSKQNTLKVTVPMKPKVERSKGHRGRKLQRKGRNCDKHKNILLWQFLLDVLHDKSHNPSVMAWVDFSNGIFKIVKGQILAKLWGIYRNKSTGVKYEFLARALRHYYHKDIIRRVPGKKLTYQFGNKIDWKVSLFIAGIPRKSIEKSANMKTKTHLQKGSY